MILHLLRLCCGGSDGHRGRGQADGPGGDADGEDLEAGEVDGDPGEEGELGLRLDYLLGQADDACLDHSQGRGQGRLELLIN